MVNIYYKYTMMLEDMKISDILRHKFIAKDNLETPGVHLIIAIYL